MCFRWRSREPFIVFLLELKAFACKAAYSDARLHRREARESDAKAQGSGKSEALLSFWLGGWAPQGSLGCRKRVSSSFNTAAL